MYHEQRQLAGKDTVKGIENHNWRDPNKYEYKGTIDLAKKLSNEYAIRGPYWMPLFCRVCELFGMKEAMINMAVKPTLFEGALEKFFYVVYESCARLLNR